MRPLEASTSRLSRLNGAPAKSVMRPVGGRSVVYFVWTCTTVPPALRQAWLAARKFSTAPAASGTGSQLFSPKPTWKSTPTRAVVSGLMS